MKVLMPRLSLAMQEGTVVQWFKKEGEPVDKGEPLVEVLTEKVTYEVEAPASGVLQKIVAAEGVEVPVSGTLAIIGKPGKPLPVAEVEEVESPAEIARTITPKKRMAKKVRKHVLASPAAKHLAREYGINIADVEGSGPKERIVEADVKRHLGKATLAPRVRELLPFTGIRKTAAERVSLSARTAPHSTITMEIDMSNAAKARKENKVSFTDILVKAIAKALEEHRLLNSTLKEEQIRIYEDINIGVAVASDRGLVVPVIRNANRKSISEVASALQEYVEKARNGRLTREDLTGGTFTITNLGMYDVEVFIPIINPPEAAILGVGKITESPTIVNKRIEIKPIMYASLSFDHRIVDGAPAAQFLQRTKQILEEGKGLADTS